MNRFVLDHLNQLKEKFLNPELELRILINKSKIKRQNIILSNFDIKDIDLMKFKKYFSRRIVNEPISKIFNVKGFWKNDFYVDTNVLDPRPETELILEKILNFYPIKEKKLSILDMCTGSGCIAISLAKEYLNAEIFATEISTKAIEIAKLNAKKLDCLNRIKFINCDLINEIKKYDIVICNPPYLSERQYKKTSLEIQNFEPKNALVAKQNGYEFYYRLSKILPKILDTKSHAFIEIGSSQASEVIDIFNSNKVKLIETVKDIQNFDRLLILNKP